MKMIVLGDQIANFIINYIHLNLRYIYIIRQSRQGLSFGFLSFFVCLDLTPH